MFSRRGFLKCLGIAVSMPAIVHVQNLMPVATVEGGWTSWSGEWARGVVPTEEIYAELVKMTREAFLPRFAASVYRESPLLRYALSEVSNGPG